jgi:hypothetical protein
MKTRPTGPSLSFALRLLDEVFKIATTVGECPSGLGHRELIRSGTAADYIGT